MLKNRYCLSRTHSKKAIVAVLVVCFLAPMLPANMFVWKVKGESEGTAYNFELECSLNLGELTFKTAEVAAIARWNSTAKFTHIARNLGPAENYVVSITHTLDAENISLWSVTHPTNITLGAVNTNEIFSVSVILSLPAGYDLSLVEDKICKVNIIASSPDNIQRTSVMVKANNYQPVLEVLPPTHQYLTPGRSVSYKIDITHAGKAYEDVIDLTYSGLPQNWWIDFYEEDGKTPLNDTNGDTPYRYLDTGILNPGETRTIVVNITRTAPADPETIRGEIAKIKIIGRSWGAYQKGLFQNSTDVMETTLTWVLYSISDENMRVNGTHPYYGSKFSGHNTNPGRRTTYVINVTKVSHSISTVNLEINASLSNITAGWNATLSKTSITFLDTAPVGSYELVYLNATPPLNAKEGDTAEVVVKSTNLALKPLKFITRVTTDKKTYILNLDGMPPEYVDKMPMKNISQIASEGSRYLNCTVTMPAWTSSSHTSIITSSTIKSHGVFHAGVTYLGWNETSRLPEMRDYQPSDIQVNSIYDAIKYYDPYLRTGIVSGKNWVAEMWRGPNCDVVANGVSHPEYISGPTEYVLGYGEWNVTNRSIGYPIWVGPILLYIIERLDLGPDGYTVTYWKGGARIDSIAAKSMPNDRWVIDSTMKTIEYEDPDFLYILLGNPDEAGHLYGNAYDGAVNIHDWANPEQMIAVMNNTDAAIGNFTKFLSKRGWYNESLLVITSDHGMSTSFDLYEKNVNVWEILENNNISMGENYTFCAQGGGAAMLFGFKSNATREKAKNILKNATGVWAVLNQTEMNTHINNHTGKPCSIYNKYVATSTDQEWPELIVFFQPHYDTPASPELIAELMARTFGGGGVRYTPPTTTRGSLQREINLMGTHAGWSEQRVALILRGPGIKAGYTNTDPVGIHQTLDIIPTISALNDWVCIDGLFLDHTEEGQCLADAIVNNITLLNYTYTGKLRLRQGWNLISPVTTGICYKASNLAKKIPGCTSIAYWDRTLGRFVMHIVGTPIGDFKIEEGWALFVNVSASTDFSIYGRAIPLGRLPRDWGDNWNSIGCFNPAITNAQSFAESIGFNCTYVKRWNATVQSWENYTRDTFINNFEVVYGGGYMVYIQSSTMFRNTPERTGFSSSTVPATASIAWSFPLADGVESTPAIADGKVVFGSDDGYIYVLDEAMGELSWKNKTGGRIRSSPAIDVAYGCVYVGSDDGILYAFYLSNSTLKWKFPTGGSICSSPVVTDSKIFVGSSDGKVYCLNRANGGKVWEYATGGAVRSSPAVRDGKIFIGSDDCNIYCLNATTGTVIWSYNTTYVVRSSPAVAYGKIFFGAGNKIYAFFENGTICWMREVLPGGTFIVKEQSPAVADGAVFIGGESLLLYGGAIYAFYENNGTLKWKFEGGGDFTSPSIADGKVLVGARERIILPSEETYLSLYCLCAENGTIEWRTPLYTLSSPAIANGRIFVGGSNGTYAYGSRTVSAGKSVNRTLIITNWWDITETVTLELLDVLPGWSATIDNTCITLGAGESTAVTLTIISPSAACEGDTANIAVKQKFQTTGQEMIISTTTIVAESYSFDLAVVPTEISIKPGEIAEYYVTINNTGTVADTYFIKVMSSLNASWITTVTSLSINPHENSTIKIKITLPSDLALMENATYNIAVSVTSSSIDTLRKEVAVQLTIIATKESKVGYTIEEVTGLITTLEGMNTPQGIKNSLRAKLQTALSKLDTALGDIVNGNDDHADNMLSVAKQNLQAFINEVEAQRGKKISEEDDDILVGAAQTITQHIDNAIATRL